MAPSSAVGRSARQRDAPGLAFGDGDGDGLRLRIGEGVLVGRPRSGYRLAGHLPQADDLGPGPAARALALRFVRDVLDEVVNTRTSGRAVLWRGHSPPLVKYRPAIGPFPRPQLRISTEAGRYGRFRNDAWWS